tara:strand:- start:221 stop:427 length:207 start_codon:yes stop_codon:yes gene_type:complete
MKKIIYPTENGISVLTPTGELSLEKTALKDVPTGVKYKIIEDTDLPKDRSFRNAWDFDFSKDFDGVGA